MDHKEYEAALNKGMAIATEHFAEIELAICKGRRMAFEGFMDWLNVCVNAARKDLKRTNDPKGVLDTTLTAMEYMRDEYRDKLSSAVNLISKSMSGKDAKRPNSAAGKKQKV